MLPVAALTASTSSTSADAAANLPGVDVIDRAIEEPCWKNPVGRTLKGTRFARKLHRATDELSDGHTNPEVGAQLFISPRTVQYHLHKAFEGSSLTGGSRVPGSVRP